MNRRQLLLNDLRRRLAAFLAPELANVLAPELEGPGSVLSAIVQRFVAAEVERYGSVMSGTVKQLVLDDLKQLVLDDVKQLVLDDVKEFVLDDARQIVTAEIQHYGRSIKINCIDPLRRHLDNAEAVALILTQCCNEVGKDVIVEDGAFLFGGKYHDGVGLRLGDGVRVYPGSHLVIDQVSPDSGIVLGAGVSLNYNCFVDGSGGVQIGSGTIVGPNVVILSSKHTILEGAPISRSGKTFHPVVIGKDVWIGANVVILAGLMIGDRAVLGAGSIVTHDVPAGSVVAGNPARPLS